MLERKLLEHAGEEMKLEEGRNATGLNRTEEWVRMHRCIQMEYQCHAELEGSCGSSALESCEVGVHLNPDDSASNEGAFLRVAVGTHLDVELSDAKGSTGLERMLDVSKRLCANAARNRADKVARSPWKTSVDVNP